MGKGEDKNEIISTPSEQIEEHLEKLSNHFNTETKLTKRLDELKTKISAYPKAYMPVKFVKFSLTSIMS
jgi:hypothetical protein